MAALRTIIVISALIAVTLPSLSAAGAPSVEQFTFERARLQEQRAELRAQVVADRQRRAAEGDEAIRALVEEAKLNRLPGQKQQLLAMVQAVRRLNRERAAPLQELVEALPPPPDELGKRAERDWERTRIKQLKATLGRTGELLNRSLEAGMTDLAYEFLREVLTFDPDRAPVRRQLGQSQINGEWLGPFGAQMSEMGLRWDNTLGWIARDFPERYAAGEFFDLQTRQWTTLEAANQQHASVSDPWVIRTAHLEITGTTDLANLVDVANNLENFYAQIFAAYASFFTKSKADYKLVFGMMQHDPLKVWVYKDRDEYLKQNPDIPQWSAGVFKSGPKTSYFYGKVGGVMYHEFTHQILHVFSGTNRSPPWLTESIAVYTESPTYHDGDLVLGDIDASRKIRGHLRAVKAGKHMKLDELLRIDTGDKWSGTKDPGPQYAAAGALAWFCMEADDRAYRGDFIDFVRDSYLGKAEYPLWAYLGMDEYEFKQRYQAWEEQTAGK